jgi:hypothetical protein
MSCTVWPVDPQLLRAEVEAMLDALLHALDERLPALAVRGVYFKGSASKVWLAPCDDVPELSDLDLHVWLHEDASADYEARFQETLFGLAFAEAAEGAFLHRVPTPRHLPRPQVLILNDAVRGRGPAPTPGCCAVSPTPAPTPPRRRTVRGCCR